MTNNKLTLLITRPQHQAHRLSQRLDQQGRQCILLPTLTILPFTDPVPPTDLHPKSVAIFVSANAVLHAPLDWSKPPQTIIAIGPGTAAALNAKGCPPTNQPHHYSSEGLLALPILQSVNGQSIVIYAGKDNQLMLANILKQRGAQVFTICCYQRQCPLYSPQQLAAIMRHPIHIIISTSATSLKNCYDIFNNHHDWLLSKQLLVISTKMAALAKTLQFKLPTIIAENASDDTIVQTVNRHFPVA